MLATSRTGTATWKRIRTEALREAQDNGLTHCPCREQCKHHKGRQCTVPLDYETGRTPNSAEADHINAWGRGGPDRRENVRVCCRRCNQARGDRPLAPTITPPTTTTTLVKW